MISQILLCAVSAVCVLERSVTAVGITEQMCIDRGCCYRAGSDPSCYYPNVGMGNITKVHVVHGCHFDAGFVDTTVNIVNRYFDEIFPRVYTVFDCNPHHV